MKNLDFKCIIAKLMVVVMIAGSCLFVNDTELQTRAEEANVPTSSSEALDKLKDSMNNTSSSDAVDKIKDSMNNTSSSDAVDKLKDSLNNVSGDANNNSNTNSTNNTSANEIVNTISNTTLPTSSSDAIDLISSIVNNGNTNGNGNTNTNNSSLSDSLAPTTAVSNFKIVSTTVDSVTVSWTRSTEANWYVIAYKPTGSGSNFEMLTNLGDVDRAQIMNLQQCEYTFYVMPAKRSDDGTLHYSALVKTKVYCCPTAKKPTGLKINNKGTGYCSLIISGLGNSDTSYYDSEAVLYDYQGKKLGTYYGEPTGITMTDTRIKKSHFYSVKVRGYYLMPDGSKIYGAWTKKKYFSIPLRTVKGSVKGTTVSLNWSKAYNANSYTVYMRKSSSANYKKIKTVKSTSTKVNKYGTKNFMKGYTYYIKIQANKKVGNTTYHCNSSVYKVRIPK